MVSPNRRHGGETPEQLTAEITRGIDDATQAILWCRRHLQERKTSETLRLAQLNIAYLSLALDWQMEGELVKASSALDRIWWQPYTDDGETVDLPPGAH
jgi:exonuclease VII large subunit